MGRPLSAVWSGGPVAQEARGSRRAPGRFDETHRDHRRPCSATPLPIAALYRQVVRFSQNLGERAPSYGTVFNIVRRSGADLVLLAHEGAKVYSETFELVHRREAAGPTPSGRPTTGRSIFG